MSFIDDGASLVPLNSNTLANASSSQFGVDVNTTQSISAQNPSNASSNGANGGNDEKEIEEVEDDENEDEDDEEEDEEDEDEEDEEEQAGRRPKKAKRSHKQSVMSRFLDLSAVVDDDDDESDDEDEALGDRFIAGGLNDEDDGDDDLRAARHARLDRRDRELDNEDLEKIAAGFEKRVRTSAKRYTGDMNDVPQRLLMPSVHDAGLWQIRVKTGRERDIVFSLMRKAIDLEYTARNINILSAFQRDSLPGMVYVEARSSAQVSQACQGLVGIYLSRGVNLVAIDEMATLLQIKKQDVTIVPGMWVRIRRSKYQGDLAQVVDISETGEDIGLKFIPRIDLNPKDELSFDGKKRKKVSSSLATRPPQRFFNAEEVIKAYGRKSVVRKNQVYVFANDTYKDGFIEKDFKPNALVLENVNPTLDEIAKFTAGMDAGDIDANVDLSAIAEASRKAAIAVLRPGDHVEVFEGETVGVQGTVVAIADEVVTIEPRGSDIDGQKIDVPARSVRKRFKPGDHVKVMAGKNTEETGLVVSVEGNVVTFLSDMTLQEVSVFSKDLREAAEVGSGSNIVGNYELHDLVQLDAATVGVIFKTERDSFRVLDQNGQVRLVQPQQISMRKESNRAIANDSEGHELRINDNVKEVEGEGRKGTVIHIHQSFFAFLYNREINENNGIFVTRCRSLSSLAPKGKVNKVGLDSTKMNPATAGGAQGGGMVGSGNMGRGPRDRLIGLSVQVIKGLHKGYIGVVKETNGTLVRVELSAGNKVVAFEREKLKRRTPDGQLQELETAFSNMGPPRGGAINRGTTINPYANAGGRTPYAGAGGRTPYNGGKTPNPYAAEGGRTPAWGSGRTPNPYADGGKTPAWNAGSATPNPYAQGGRTPAWNASSRTPFGAGQSSYGGATPGRNYGGATPGRSAWDTGGSGWGTSYGESSNSYGASAATPANAPTPGAAFAPTPAANYTTPAGYGYHMETPAGVAATPASAPTPAFASTPGFSGATDSVFIPSAYWLNESSIRGPPAKRVIVRVEGTRPEGGKAGWNGGDFEDEEGYVLKIFDFQGTETIANVQWFNPNRSAMNVPIQFLRPVEPRTRGDAALVIGGKWKGREVRVREAENSDFLVSDSNMEVFDCRDDHMVKLHM